MYPLVTAVSFLSLITLATLYWSLRHFLNRKSNGSTYRQLMNAMKEVLHPRIDIPNLLRERAESNQRLVRALKISNTFVSVDPGVHKKFVGQVQHLLNGAKRQGWASFQAISLEAAQWELSHRAEILDDHIPFDSFVQNVTLVVVLIGILQVQQPIESFSHEDVTIVANRITTLWALSKKQEPISPVFLSQLTQSLGRLVVDNERFPNPLNFVVPAWETLWRVVATTVAHSYNSEKIRDIFCTFNARPSDDDFRAENQTGVSVKCVVNEAMRLYPPSKRIARSRKRGWCPSFIYNWFETSITRTKQYADVGTLLRCHIWGLDACEFRPSRHSYCHDTQYAPEREEALMFVFGHGPLRCIASSWAPMASAVISGAILNHLQTERYTLIAGKAIGGRDGWLGWSLILQHE